MHHFSSISEAGLDVFHPLWRRRIEGGSASWYAWAERKRICHLLFYWCIWAGDTVTRKSRAGFMLTWIMLLSIGVPRDRGVLIVRLTRLSLHNTFVRWDICWGLFEDLYVGDDQSVLSNMMMYQGSTCLKKKCAAAAVAFHFVREGVTREEAIDNRSILMKCWLSAWKSMALGAKRSTFVEKILQFISDGVRSD